tara:strand:+ start:1324 stop:2361 length:1038 start_codon:yes stop_codon:yes gene_type:complete
MTSLFRIENNKLSPIKRASLPNERQLEDWISSDPLIIGLDVMIIGRQVKTDFNKYIDLLAIDSEGDLTIIELKKDRTPRDVVGQILDYASWVCCLTTREVYEVAAEYLRKPLAEAFLEKFERPLPEKLSDNHSMIIVASEFDPSSARIVEYLAEYHDVNINTAFFKVFDFNGDLVLATDWLMDQQEVIERSESKKKAPWSGFWYTNVGDDGTRSWEDMRKYGFLAAGGGSFFSKRLDQLNIGDPIFAYQKSMGYVGYGIITQTKIQAKDFEVDETPLFELPLEEDNIKHDCDDPELAEYVVGVDWKKTFPISEAKKFIGAFANQNIVCKLRDPATLEFLKTTFSV